MEFLYVPIQAGFLLAVLVTLYFLTRRIAYVVSGQPDTADSPFIVVLYPLLRERKTTIRTTLIGHQRMAYPSNRWKMVAVLNWHDEGTIRSIQELMLEFSFLDLIVMPPCDDPTWRIVWDAWHANAHCYWWHQGKTKYNCDLPPKKTRQLIYAFYHLNERMADEPWIVNYIDADSIPPPDHFSLAAAGLNGQCDFAQSTNTAGNLLDTEMSSLCAFDHMVWDGFVYPHMASGHPYYCLGKGLFVRSTDVYNLGSWNPYITIEDPEFGLRFWKNGMKLGIIASPLIEEVPNTFGGWLHQRNRWMCGFFQTLGHPLTDLGFTPKEKILARLNLVPTLSLLLNTVNVPLSLPVILQVVRQRVTFPLWIDLLSAIDLASLGAFLACFYFVSWKRSYFVRHSAIDSWRYLLQVNPVFVMVYWSLWSLPIVVGFAMCLTDKGKVWKRTEKIDANHDLVLDERGPGGEVAVGVAAVDTGAPSVLWRDT